MTKILNHKANLIHRPIVDTDYLILHLINFYYRIKII